jgi:predicted dehydrogenase
VVGTVERDPEFGVDRLCAGMLRFPSGHATFTVGGQIVHHQRMELYGTRGRIEVEIPYSPTADHAARVLVDDGRDLLGGGVEAIELEPVDQFTLQAERFAEAVRGVGAVPVSLEDAVANMAVIDAIFRSLQTGRWERP